MSKKKIIIVDDFDEIRELVAFIVEANIDCETVQFSSGNKVIAELKKNPHYDIIISDFNMPDGDGLAILNYLRSQNLKTPIAFLSGDEVERNPHLQDLLGTQVGTIPKPFTDQEIISTITTLTTHRAPKEHPTPPNGPSDYIAVRLQLLVYVHEIATPLFVKINDDKFVRLTHDESLFTAETLKKYEAKQVSHLYIESSASEEFIAEYKKRALATKMWTEASERPDAQFIKLNTELLRDLSTRLGWSESLIDLAADNLTRALQIASTHPKLSHVLRQFQKIEHFGFADHSSLMVMLTCGLAFQLEVADEATLRKLTFASLLHDMQLTDDEFVSQTKIVKSIHAGKIAESREFKNILSHPTRAAELCRQWDFCPGVVDTIIFEHHETTDGEGFPMGKKGSELHPLSCLFIVAEDFANYFAETFGNVDLDYFLKSRRTIYRDGEFKRALEALGQSLYAQNQTAS